MDNLDKKEAPWTEDQIKALNDYQHGRGVWSGPGRMHPYTCGGPKHDAAHREYAKKHSQDEGLLIPTPNGWVCPVCDYKQNWALTFTMDNE